jgi:hypothetical protein
MLTFLDIGTKYLNQIPAFAGMTQRDEGFYCLLPTAYCLLLRGGGGGLWDLSEQLLDLRF